MLVRDVMIRGPGPLRVTITGNRSLQVHADNLSGILEMRSGRGSGIAAEATSDQHLDRGERMRTDDLWDGRGSLRRKRRSLESHPIELRYDADRRLTPARRGQGGFAAPVWSLAEQLGENERRNRGFPSVGPARVAVAS